MSVVVNAAHAAVVLVYFTTTTLSQSTCNKAYECVGASLNASSATLDIDGYKAAMGPTTSFFSADIDNKILCRASHACDSMSSMTTPAVNCRGTYSCANISMQAGATDSFCYALNSCRFSTITMFPNSGGNWWCNGEQSCAESTIYAINKLHATGAYALYYANIYSHVQNPNISTTLTLRLSGKLSGYGATFTCLAGHVCKIKCDGHDSCSMLQINGPGKYGIQLATANTTAPITSDINPPSLDITPIDTEEMCNTHSSALLVDDKYGHKEVGIVVQNDTEGPVCCRSLAGCQSTNITINTSQSLICSGGFSCQYSNIMMNDGSVYCEGGCSYANIYNASHLYCFGYQSCMLSTIRSTEYISCSGKSCCKDAVIHSAGTDLNVSFTANEAGVGAVIYCNANDVCNVVCGAKSACVDTMLYCYGSCTVRCDPESSCPQEVTLNPTLTPMITIDPTHSPIYMYSTANPTMKPSLEPTQSPSYMYPTANPLTVPTMAPNDNRSVFTSSSSPTHATSSSVDIQTNDTTYYPIVVEKETTAYFEEETTMKTTTAETSPAQEATETEVIETTASMKTETSINDVVVIEEETIIIVAVVSLFTFAVFIGIIIHCKKRKQQKKNSELIAINNSVATNTHDNDAQSRDAMDSKTENKAGEGRDIFNDKNTKTTGHVLELIENKKTSGAPVCINPQLVMCGSAMMTRGGANDAKLNKNITHSGADINTQLVMSGSAIKTRVVGEEASDNIQVAREFNPNQQQKNGNRVDAEGNNVNRCTECGLVKKGQIWSTDGAFYCNECWANYYNDDKPTDM